MNDRGNELLGEIVKKIVAGAFVFVTVLPAYSHWELESVETTSNSMNRYTKEPLGQSSDEAVPHLNSFVEEMGSMASSIDNSRSQCEGYYITWIGVIDNGEGDGWPHGPLGNLHLQLYDCSGEEVSHTIIEGPSDNEWLDGDSKSVCIYIGSSSCIYYVSIWESDGGRTWQRILGRKDDILFSGVPNQPGIWSSGRPAKADARKNAMRRGAYSWVKSVWSGGIQPGIPSMFIEVSYSCE